MNTTTDKQLQDHVNSIANDLSNPDKWIKEFTPNVDGEEANAMDWLQDALDIRYIVSGTEPDDFISAQVLVAFGGPNIWVNFDEKQVVGYWGGDVAKANFTDNLGVEDELQELWSCK